MRDTIEIWRPKSFDGVECLSGTLRRQAFGRHFHETYCLPLVQLGAMASFYRRRQQLLVPGEFDLLSPGEPHTGHAANDLRCTYRCFYLSATFVRKVAGSEGGTSPLPNVSGRLKNRRLFTRLVRAHSLLEKDGDRLEAETLLAETLAALFEHHADGGTLLRQPAREPRAVAYIRQLLIDRFAEQISLAELATLAQLNPVYLVRVFRRKVGLPPHAFQRQIRISRAQQLIAVGVSIAEAAVETGFSDQSHLTRVFHETVGTTPGRYARGSARSRRARAPAAS